MDFIKTTTYMYQYGLLLNSKVYYGCFNRSKMCAYSKSVKDCYHKGLTTSVVENI